MQKPFRKIHNNFITNTEKSITENLHHFWEFVNSLIKNTGISETMFYNDSKSTNHSGSVELFKNYFQSILRPIYSYQSPNTNL